MIATTRGKMTTGEVAERLGVDISTVSKWAYIGCNGIFLRGQKIGGRWFFTEEDLAAFVEACNRRDGEVRR
jgi:excisionase family DNA binding protein